MEKRKRLFPWAAGLVILIWLASGSRAAFAASAVDVTGDRAVLAFPNTITFQIKAASATGINSLMLEYGDIQQTCGQVVAKAFPQMTPGTAIQAEWTWDMRQSGSWPPGAQIWWRWHLTDSTGQETVTDKQTITWLDNVHAWKSLSKGDIRLHWYNNSQDFAQQLLDAADSGLSNVESQVGLSNDEPIDLYIYPDTGAMQDAILYEPSWTGGQAFPAENIVIIAIEASQLNWGKGTEVHELTHVLVGHLTFSCLGSLPAWLGEGLATYAEGPLDKQFQGPLDQAIHDDKLLSVRSISGPFSAESDKASLSYGESQSLVAFLIKTYGRDKMSSLLLLLRDGSTPDQALSSAYGFNTEGLEDAWRTSIGAKPRPVASNPTALPAPTIVPTIVPVSGALQAITPTPFSYPTLPPAAPARTAPPLSLTLTLVCTCAALALVLGVIVLGVIVAMNRSKGGSDETRP